MATNTLFDDDFSGYAPGSDNITGFFDTNFFNPGEVVNFSTQTGSSQAPGFFERAGKGYHLLGRPGLAHQEVTEVSNSMITWAGWSGGFSQPMIAVDNADLSGGTSSSVISQSIAAIYVNSDSTCSFVVPSTQGGALFGGSAYIATTTSQVVYPFTWQYFQVKFAFTPTLISSTSFVVATCLFAVDGTTVINAVATTGVPVLSLWTMDAKINQWRFFCDNGPSYLGDITGITVNGTDSLPSIGTFPHPFTPRDALYTQSTIEMVREPDIRKAHFTQAVIERPRIPTLRPARMTQGVIELLRRSTSSGYWVVYEG